VATVLQLCQSVCYESNQPAPSSLYGSTDPAALQLLHLFYAVGRELRQAKCWRQLLKTHTITTVSGQTEYDLPSDFFSSTLDTAWDQTNSRRLVGPVSDSTYNEVVYGVATVAHKFYRIFGLPGASQIQIQPSPPDDETLSFDYICKNWIQQADTWTESEAIEADTDTCVFDDDLMILGLKAYFYREKGWDYQAIMADFQSRIAAAQARYQGYKIGKMGGGSRANWWNAPDGDFAL
jgi:hypothetical protein